MIMFNPYWVLLYQKYKIVANKEAVLQSFALVIVVVAVGLRVWLNMWGAGLSSTRD